MNKQQVMDLLKGLTVAGGPLAVVITVIVGGDSTKANTIAGAIGSVISIAGVVWTIIDATRANTALKAASLPGVQVHVNPAKADPTVTAVALAEPSTPSDPVADVVPMEGGPRTDK